LGDRPVHVLRDNVKDVTDGVNFGSVAVVLDKLICLRVGFQVIPHLWCWGTCLLVLGIANFLQSTHLSPGGFNWQFCSPLFDEDIVSRHRSGYWMPVTDVSVWWVDKIDEHLSIHRLELLFADCCGYLGLWMGLSDW
jgi:hypothetical protein